MVNLNTLYIRNMVCPRCISVVKHEMEKLDLPVVEIRLGEVDLTTELNADLTDKVRDALAGHGFELLEDRKAGLVENVKTIVIELIRTGAIEDLHVNLSNYLAERIGKDYHYISTAFSEQEGVTLARYMVLQKIERVKELIKYNELTLSQIAHQLGYSSVAHLSAQFKQITGATPSEFKKGNTWPRKPLDQVL
jgi:AraC family transcriptional regulator